MTVLPILGSLRVLKLYVFRLHQLSHASFDRDLIENVGNALGKECQSEDISVPLGPGINMKRSPLCGRNFEYFSEDPYLAGEMGAAFVNGVQKNDIGNKP